MKYIKLILSLLTLFLLILFFISNCEKKPTAPDGINYSGRPPIASFTVTPTSGDKSTVFSFNASGCSDYDEPIDSLQVRWDWEGDGSYDTNYSTSKTATHQYNSYGTKNVILQVKDSDDLSDSTQKTISVIWPFEGMVYVAGGSFQMGSTPGSSDEKPVHTVTLNSFYIDQYEVTNAKYAAYLNAALAARHIQASSSTVTKAGNELLDLDDLDCQIYYSDGTFVVDNGKDNYPVIEVTWYGANSYAEFYGKRLPTEAEWEYAARGGYLSQSHTYSGSNNIGNVAWYLENSANADNPIYQGKGTHTVGTKQPNELGIYDMSGNVWEWCNDWYDSGYYSSSPNNNPTGPSTGTVRVLRSGSWFSSASLCRVANRYWKNPVVSNNNYGFRVVQNSF